MDTLLNKFSYDVNSTITGFDRIVFKGMLKPIMYAQGMELFLRQRGVLNKEYKEYTTKQTSMIIDSANKYVRNERGEDITYIPSSYTRKEELAHERQRKENIKEGLIGVWSCVESCNTFKGTYSNKQNHPEISFVRGKCKHLYFYFDDITYGFMSIRLQTWAPYEVQVALNGREWLRRSLDKAGCNYVINGNKFLYIRDYDLAQELLNEQPKADFGLMLFDFLSLVFPCKEEVVGGLNYYWTYWQTEVAKDYIFKDVTRLNELMYDLQLHAMITGTGDRILKYFGTPVKLDGMPFRDNNPEIITKTNNWYDGTRVRHWSNKNSVKFYNEHNILRFEMTMNDPSRFKVHRYTEKQSVKDKKKLLPMRKGVVDSSNRFEVSKGIINSFTEHMAAFEEKTRFGEIIEPVVTSITDKGKKYRGLDLFGKDKELLRIIADPIFNVEAITNAQIQKMVTGTTWAKKMTRKQLSGRISRHLVLLRKHGIIRKLPNQRKYALTDKGRKLTAALQVASASAINDLLKSAA